MDRLEVDSGHWNRIERLGMVRPPYSSATK